MSIKKSTEVSAHKRINPKTGEFIPVRDHVRNYSVTEARNQAAGAAAGLHGLQEEDSTVEEAKAKLDEGKLKAARLFVSVNYPYYSKLVYRMPIIETRSQPTFAVDKYGRIYINPDYANNLEVEKYAAALIHEYNHFIRGHHDRFENRPGTKANLSGDCEINDDLADDPKLKVDEKWIYPDKTFGLPTGKLAEFYYKEIPEETQECPDCGRKKVRYVTVEGQKQKAAEQA